MTGFNREHFAVCPQLVSIEILGHALQATNHAMVTVHPELGDENLEDASDVTKRAMRVVSMISRLQSELDAYRIAVEVDINAFFESVPF